MTINKIGEAGTTDSGDILIRIEPNEGQGVVINLSGKPAVLKPFGKQIEKVISDTVTAGGLENVTVQAQDNGALDYVIRARIEGAIARAL